MKNKFVSACERLSSDLASGSKMDVKDVLELDQRLDDAMLVFEGTLTASQTGLWNEISAAVEAVRAQARLSVLGDESPEELKGMIVNMKERVSESEDYDEAMVQIEREMHQHSGKISDIFKSLLMWKDSPDERIVK